MIRIILEGLMLGLSAGIYCVGACLVFFAPYLLIDGRRKIIETSRKVLSFMLGRLIAYISFALIMSFIGSSYRNILTARFFNICLVAASSFMLIYSLAHNFRDSRFCARFIDRFSMARVPFFLGLFTGLNPCPPFLVGAARIWTINAAMESVVLFIAFFAGTSVYMIPLIFVPYLSGSERTRQIGIMVAFLSGLWFFFVGISGLTR